jgi:hypothetical protein
MAASWRESGSSVTAVEVVDDNNEEEEEVARDPKASRFRRPWITANVWLEVEALVVDVDNPSEREHWGSTPDDGAFLGADGAGLTGAKP